MITVLTGENAYAVTHKLATLKQQFVSLYGDAGLEVISAEKLEANQLSSLTGGATLFATQRLIIIHTISAHKALSEEFLRLVKQIPNEVHVVLVEAVMDKRTSLYKTLKKEADFQEFPLLDEVAVAQWVTQVIKNSGGQSTAQVIKKLVQYVGTDQFRLENELQKLLAYDQKITEQNVEALVEKNPQDTVFQLLDHALTGKTVGALKILEELERVHEDPFQIANMLVWQVNVLAIVASAETVSDAEIAKRATLNPFVVKKTRSLSRKITHAQFKAILDAVANCDIMLKTSSTEPWRVIENTILSLG